MRHDKSRLYGPGLVLIGLSVVVAGALVIPSGILHEQGRHSPWWPRIKLGWRIVQAGFLIGLGCVLVAAVVSNVF